MRVFVFVFVFLFLFFLSGEKMNTLTLAGLM